MPLSVSTAWLVSSLRDTPTFDLVSRSKRFSAAELLLLLLLGPATRLSLSAFQLIKPNSNYCIFFPVIDLIIVFFCKYFLRVKNSRKKIQFPDDHSPLLLLLLKARQKLWPFYFLLSDDRTRWREIILNFLHFSDRILFVVLPPRPRHRVPHAKPFTSWICCCCCFYWPMKLADGHG